MGPMVGKRFKGIGCQLLTGYGFKAPLDAISQHLDPDLYELTVIDFFGHLGLDRWDRFWKGVWRRVLEHPAILKFNYALSRPLLLKIYQRVVFHSTKDRLISWLEEERPDFIITSHFVTTLLLPYALKRLGYAIPVFAYNAEVVSAHYSNVSPLVDACFSPTPEGTAELIRHGQPEQTIFSAPFPINAKFVGKEGSAAEARKLHGFREMFTMLISFGGDGFGSTEVVELIAREKLPVQILAVAGKSEKIYRELESIQNQYPHGAITIYRFVDTMPDLMACSDLCAGKAGMNACFESIFMKKPYMATSALVNEEATMRYLRDHGFGWIALDSRTQLEIVRSCLSNPDFYQDAVKRLEAGKVDFSTAAYNELIGSLLQARKKAYLRDSRALYFDMAGTLCDIPIGDIWEEVNRDGIILVMEYLGWRELLPGDGFHEMADAFVEHKKVHRRVSKKSLQEAAIRDQLTDFVCFCEEAFPLIRERRGMETLTETDLERMEKLFVSTELNITIPFEGVVPVLEELSRFFDLYLLSNNVSRQLVIDILDKIGCSHCFRKIFVSVDCGYRKPHEAFLNYVESETGVPSSESVMIGDRLTQDIRLANLHHLKSVYAAMVDHEDNDGAETEYYDYCISDFSQLLDIFLPGDHGGDY